MSIFTLAKPDQSYSKTNLTGVSGSGKTLSSLKLGKGLAGGDMSKVAVVDTEGGSASLYARGDLTGFITAKMTAPFSPPKYVRALEEAIKAGMKVIIFDSASHSWDGEGGCLDIHASLGGRFQDWAKVTPMYREMISKFIAAPIHVITTTRRKTDYEISDEGGKKKITKVGLKEIQRDGWEYEFTISFDINIDHKSIASKDRTGMFSDGVPFIITEETGSKILNWLNGNVNG